MALPFRRTGSIDGDAAAFCVRSGASNTRAISDFVKSVKSLGLWSSMLCWPLRSSQNAGTGTSVYSLGGLGTYDGTIVNGASWGANGIAGNGTAYISTGLTSQLFADASSNWLLFCVALLSGNDATARTFASRAQATASLRVVQLYGTTSIYNTIVRGGAATTITGTPVAASYNTAAVGWNGSSASAYTNNNAPTAATVGTCVDDGYAFQMMSRTNGVVPMLTGDIISFAGIFNGGASMHGTIRDLYKSTLGAGLGLT